MSDSLQPHGLHQAFLPFTISQSLLKLMCIESVMLSNHLTLYRPLLLLPSILLSIRVFSNKLAPHIRWTKYRSFSLSIHPSNDYSGLASFRIDWFDLPVSKELSRVFSSNTFLFILIAVTCVFSRHTFYGEFLL